jgi:hypothetical protein
MKSRSFVINKLTTNVYEFEVKKKNYPYTITVQDTDTFTFNLYDADSNLILSKELTADKTTNIVTLTLTKEDTVELSDSSLDILHKVVYTEKYTAVIDCVTVDNGIFYIDIGSAYVV